MANPRERELLMEGFSVVISTGWHLVENQCKVPHLPHSETTADLTDAGFDGDPEQRRP